MVAQPLEKKSLENQLTVDAKGMAMPQFRSRQFLTRLATAD
jgi:hypothetical protein